MRTSLTTPLRTMLASAICASLAACGGGSIDTPSLPPASLVTMGGPAITNPGTVTIPATDAASTAERGPAQGGTVPTATTTTSTSLSAGTATLTSSGTTTTTTTATASTPSFASITSVQLTSTAASPQVNTPFTFGQVFKVGDIKNTESVGAKTATGTNVPVQVDVKARHPDGSIRHAIITAQLPSSMPKQVQTIYLVKAGAAAATTGAAPTALLNAGFTASFNATIDGRVYTASADALLKSGHYTTWLAGALANEWLVSAPLKTAAGEEHPHLTARFAIRAYGTSSARVDVTLENTWAFEASPQNFTYDAQLLVGGKNVYSQAALQHYHHARWRKTFWWGTTPQLDLRHNAAYMVASKALPNYDLALGSTATAVDNWNKRWLAAKTGPMQVGLAQPYMPTTGGRPDIGLLPAWNALYLVSMDPRMKNIMVGMSEQAGSWSSHYRNKATGKPVTLAEFPYMTLLGAASDTLNPVTKLREAFPVCPATACTTPLVADTSHQPAFAYLPYMVTGDYYHLEELEFWANYSAFSLNPGYREYGKGLFKSDQIRAQAWSMRTTAQAAYILPDNDPQKALFTNIVNNNLDWYNANYTNNTAANKLGVLVHSYALAYNNSTGLAPWQDDFFTSAIGVAADLGFTRAQPLLAWKAKFPIDRMTGPGFCWISGAIYSMKVRDSATSPIYNTIAEAYKASSTEQLFPLGCNSQAMATLLGLKVGEMSGYAGLPTGYPSNMQPALAYAAGAATGGPAAWKVFAARTVKPDYTQEPQFNIIPR